MKGMKYLSVCALSLCINTIAFAGDNATHRAMEHSAGLFKNESAFVLQTSTGHGTRLREYTTEHKVRDVNALPATALGKFDIVTERYFMRGGAPF